MLITDSRSANFWEDSEVKDILKLACVDWYLSPATKVIFSNHSDIAV